MPWLQGPESFLGTEEIVLLRKDERRQGTGLCHPAEVKRRSLKNMWNGNDKLISVTLLLLLVWTEFSAFVCSSKQFALKWTPSISMGSWLDATIIYLYFTPKNHNNHLSFKIPFLFSSDRTRKKRSGIVDAICQVITKTSPPCPTSVSIGVDLPPPPCLFVYV